MSYTKLSSDLITSSLWGESAEIRIVWITMLAMANRHGEVIATIPGLARLASVPVPVTEQAVQKFLSPDPYSRTPDDEGRRIEVIEGGWALLNHAKYRDKDSKEDAKLANAIRQRRYRARKSGMQPKDLESKCSYCGRKATGFDHVEPRSIGGGDGPENCVPCCRRCNCTKRTMPLVDFLNRKDLPFKLRYDLIFSSPALVSRVSLDENGRWIAVTNRNDALQITQDRDIADADADVSITKVTETEEGFALTAEDRPEKPSPKTSKAKGSESEVVEFALSLGVPESDGIYMFNLWESNGWMRGNSKIKDWKAAFRAWYSARYLPSQKEVAADPRQSKSFRDGWGSKL